MKSLVNYLNESLMTENEESIKNEKDFRDYAENKFKTAFGDKLDEEKMNEVIDGILDKYSKEAEAGEWGTLVGVLNKSFA